jgi:xanthine/CO dehydrogenase XdhC/CoxF family maturation factor
MHEIDKTLAAVRRVAEEGKRGILVTIVGTRGSTYRRAGARAVISEDGESFGTLSGGCLERDLAERARAWLGDPTPRLFTYDTTNATDVVFGLGLGCRGVIDVFIEPFDAQNLPRLAREFRWNGREPVVWTTTLGGRELLVESIRPERAIAIFGGGADVAPVARMVEQLGWRAAVISPKDMHPETVKERVDFGAFDAVVVMTHHFLHDLALLAAILPSPIPYVGLLGPKSRGDELLAQLGETRTPRIHSPIGLDFGGETPEEIALAIVAEIQAVLNQRDGKPLRDAEGPIHQREAVHPERSEGST